MVWNGFLWVIEHLCLWICQNVSKRPNTKGLIAAADTDPVNFALKEGKLPPMDCCDR